MRLPERIELRRTGAQQQHRRRTATSMAHPQTGEAHRHLGGQHQADVLGTRSDRCAAGSGALDRDVFRDFVDRNNPEGARAILVHELAHVVGLAHVDDPGELMYAENTGRTGLGPGDREGLARLGAVG